MRRDRAGPFLKRARREAAFVRPDGAMSDQLKPANVESVWKEVESELEREKDRIYAAIRSYPPPITACDGQFDQLLEQRERISRELKRMREISRASLTHEDPAGLSDEFIRSSTCMGGTAGERIRSSLRQVLPQ